MYLKYQIQNTKTQPKRNETKQKQNKTNATNPNATSNQPSTNPKPSMIDSDTGSDTGRQAVVDSGSFIWHPSRL